VDNFEVSLPALVNLSPGTAVTLEVNMGNRRLIEFFLTERDTAHLYT